MGKIQQKGNNGKNNILEMELSMKKLKIIKNGVEMGHQFNSMGRMEKITS